ncbi:MAG TPA: TIR domain-containing protein, partial [Solirubrobacteraceae bacterium]|nr:TIR domain-containing protein [Solirubrobacteraceae bacterium]
MSDVFVSYARENSEFVDRLAEGLKERGREVWVDRGGIEPSDRWMQSVREAIERSEAVLFVLSVDSLASKVCAEELEHAVSLNKRLIPVCIEEPPDHAEIPSYLRELSWIMMRPGDDFEAGVEEILRALDTDLEVARAHTRILVRAKAWELAERRTSPLLRGDELRAAEDWLSRAGSRGGPQPTELQRDFVVASRHAATRRQRILLAGVSVALAVAVALSIFALIERGQAIHSQKLAQSRQLAAGAESNLAADASLSTLLALRALRVSYTSQAEMALRDALTRVQTLGVLTGHTDALNRAAFSPDGSRIVTASSDRTARAWNARTGRQETILRGHAALVESAAFSPDGSRVVTASVDGTARIWDARTGR